MHRTTLVTLSDGRRAVLQRLGERARAASILTLAADLPPVAQAVGVAVPELLDADGDADPPWLLRSWIPGESGVAALADPCRAQRLAAGTGRLLAALRTADLGGLRLYRGWATAGRLQALTERLLGRNLLPPAVTDRLRADLALLHTELGPAVLAHGDCSPRNTIVAADGSPRAFIDLEYARLADARFDRAWWSVLAAVDAAADVAGLARTLRQAAGGTEADEPVESALRRLRLLEAADDAARRGHPSTARWRRALLQASTVAASRPLARGDVGR